MNELPQTKNVELNLCYKGQLPDKSVRTYSTTVVIYMSTVPHTIIPACSINTTGPQNLKQLGLIGWHRVIAGDRLAPRLSLPKTDPARGHEVRNPSGTKTP